MTRWGPLPHFPKPNVLCQWYIGGTKVFRVGYRVFVTISKNALSVPLSSCKCDMLSLPNPLCHRLSLYYILATFNFCHASINVEHMVLLLIPCSSVHHIWVLHRITGPVIIMLNSVITVFRDRENYYFCLSWLHNAIQMLAQLFMSFKLTVNDQ